SALLSIRTRGAVVYWRVIVRTATSFFSFTATATTEIYTLSLHDALPICGVAAEEDAGTRARHRIARDDRHVVLVELDAEVALDRSEEHTSELQSRGHLVCRLLLEKKNETMQQHENLPESHDLNWLV